ncbi:MAG: hypothetical protein JWR10_291 [Rubritepida sp.]|nr:hypothetical protein [Rubritepida sp.]
MSGRRARSRAWTGLFAGVAAWYLAHEATLYFTRVNCRHFWVAPLFDLAGLALALAGGFVSWRTLRGSSEEVTDFGAWIGTGAALLFSIVLLWQALATGFYSGCES